MKRGVISFCFVASLFLILLISFVDAGFFSKLTGKTISSDDLIRGDVNKDGLINMDDVSTLTDHLFVTYTTPDPSWLGDLNRNGELSLLDVQLLVELVNYKRGDVNKDKIFDEKDLTFLNNYLTSKTSPPNPLDLGDLNYDDKVDSVDYSLLKVLVDKQTQTCEDSDKGMDYYTKGQVVVSSGNGASMIEDKCTTGSEIANLMEYSCSESKELVSHPYLCPEGCIDGACVKQTSDSCTDSDGGLNYYEKGKVDASDEEGIDECCDFVGVGGYSCPGTGNFLHEWYCDPITLGEDKFYTCPNGCSNGACIPIVDDSVCSDFIEDFMDGEDFSINEKTYYFSSSDIGEEDWYINGAQESAKIYYSYYYSYFDDYYHSVNYRVAVFDNKNIALQEFLKDYTDFPACTVLNVYGVDPEARVYVCNYNILWEDDHVSKYEDNNRVLIWYKDNVFVEMNTYMGRSLTNEEILIISQQKLYDFISKIKDNSRDYSSSWTNFRLDYYSELLLKKAIDSCSSQVPLDTCSPCWECNTEPLVCPAHGYKTKTCNDYCCARDSEPYEQQISCTPGICDGCLVPKWFGSGKWGKNKCIPYGFRFEQQTDNFVETIIENKESDRLDAGGVNGDYKLIIESGGRAVLTLYSGDGTPYEYILTPGGKVDLSDFADLGEYISFILYVDNIYYDSEGGSYVDVTVKYSYMGREYLKMNAYCDMDGRIYQQKTPSVDGSWVTCQNNYECASNLCSSGECIEVTKMLDEASAFKKAAVKFACRVFNPFSDTEYENCVINLLGLNTPSNGGGGSSG